MIEADIEGSKSHVDMNSWRPQASCPCGNFCDTCVKTILYRQHNCLCLFYTGSIGLDFSSLNRAGTQSQLSFWPLPLQRVSVSLELNFGQSRCLLKIVPPQPNFPTETVIDKGRPARTWVWNRGACGSSLFLSRRRRWEAQVSLRPFWPLAPFPFSPIKQNGYQGGGVSELSCLSHLRYTPNSISPFLHKVKLNRVFFPRNLQIKTVPLTVVSLTRL